MQQYVKFIKFPRFNLSTKPNVEKQCLKILDKTYLTDNFTNVTPKIITYIGRNLHNRECHPLCFTKQKIVDYFYRNFKNSRGSPLFSIYDKLNPVVSVDENFDSLLIPEGHVSRNRNECYYINRSQLLRAHTTAHQSGLIKMGLDKFIMIGDVYRRDEVDSTHFPVFHQSDAVCLFDRHQLENIAGDKVNIFDNGSSNKDSVDKQGYHTLDATKLVEIQLKSTLSNLIKSLYGNEIKSRWVDVYFPFTHPSWELEIFSNNKWMEVLGCGIIRHEILQQAGAEDKIGWAFGIGLERVAMHLYGIPDIRLFWSCDTGFLSQFKHKTIDDQITYKPVSIYPQLINDISFWLADETEFDAKEFYDVVRDVGGDIVEQVNLVDEFTHPKTGRRSLCYRITYRHLERTLNQTEVTAVHKALERCLTAKFSVTIR